MSEVAFAINREWIILEKNWGKRKISIRNSQGSCVLPPWSWCCTHFRLRRGSISVQINSPPFPPLFGKDVLTAEQQRRPARETRRLETLFSRRPWKSLEHMNVVMAMQFDGTGTLLLSQASKCSLLQPKASLHCCQPLAYPHLFSLD